MVFEHLDKSLSNDSSRAQYSHRNLVRHRYVGILQQRQIPGPRQGGQHIEVMGNACTIRAMINPWLQLKPEGPYILEMDRRSIDRFNASKNAKDETKAIVADSLPEPFIGNPESARVVLLGLNPGHSSEDETAYREASFREAIFNNLKHLHQACPFYPLNPKYGWTPTAHWWRPRTKKLREVTGMSDEQFAETLLVIEWFPYHSRRSGLPIRQVCESQSYSFWLAKKTLDDGKLVIGMRSKKHWGAAHPELVTAPFLKNPQSGFVTRGNMQDDLFDRIVSIQTAP